MDPFSAIAGVIGLITSVIGIASSVKQMGDDAETTDYNRNLNERVFAREDNAWQRAVNDRSKAGLSISGLTSGAGAGGTVSQLQASQSAGKMAELMKGLGDTSFGLAQSAYDRKLQKENFTEELKVKKDQLKVDRLNARYQRLKTLAEIASTIKANQRENAIYSHNMKIAKGEKDSELWQVYGSQPSEIKEIINALVNNKDKIFENEVVKTAENKVNEIKENVSDYINNDMKGKTRSDDEVPIKELVGEFTADKIPDGYGYLNISQSADGKQFYLHVKNNKTTDTKKISISKAQYEKIYNYLNKKGKKN